MKIIHRRNRKMRSSARDASSRRGRLFRGEGGGRASFAACPAQGAGGDGRLAERGGRAQAGALPSAGGQLDRVRPRLPGDVSLRNAAGWRGDPALHRLGAKWCSIQSNSNAKRPKFVAFLATFSGASQRPAWAAPRDRRCASPPLRHHLRRKKAAGSLRRPPRVSGLSPAA